MVGFAVAQARIRAKLRRSDPLRKRTDAISNIVSGDRCVVGLGVSVPSDWQGNPAGDDLGKARWPARLFGQEILRRRICFRDNIRTREFAK